MTFKGIENSTPFSTEMTLLCDDRGREVMVVYAKATFDITDARTIKLAPEQVPLNMAGEYLDEPGKSSMTCAPECSFIKLGTDVALLGHAHAPGGQEVCELEVFFRVGPVSKRVHVFGDRHWHYQEHDGQAHWVMGETQGFTSMPLVYERAFGGFDDSAEDEKDHEVSDYNPIGTGLIAKRTAYKDPVALPNLEHPDYLIGSVDDRPPPANFGFIGPDWEPRRQLAGNYDAEWEKTRSPLLPLDFNHWFFNAAHPDLRVSGYLRGNETIEVINASALGALNLELPGYKPMVTLDLLGRRRMKLECMMDSLTVNTDTNNVQVLWRAELDVSKLLNHMETVKISLAKLKTDKNLAA
ncbi:MAG: DUF2169 domain-containing protein [Gammaproteobacteria bacterium]|nr:DUF2169 domain-containing protein [Gammaproteobacteria bacterium]MDH5802715.1 DUF2169 domain-containing protein [Gammaproteobacteria bacterium]